MRRSLLLAAACSIAVLVPHAAHAAPPFPDKIDLPTGWRPEGIAIGEGTTFFAGSLANGNILKGDLRTGETDPNFVQSTDGQPTVGIEVDDLNRVWAAGGGSGEVRVYDGATGDLLAIYAAVTGTSFINDIVVTDDAAYATNSLDDALIVIPLGPDGSLPPEDGSELLPLSGAWVQLVGTNANGIEAWGGQLIVANSAAQALFAVDPETGVATPIDIGQPLPNVDGITRQGSHLYAVQNRLNQIALIKLHPSLGSGTVDGLITNPAFQVPTTVARFGKALYVVNAKFGISAPETQPFEVVRTELH